MRATTIFLFISMSWMLAVPAYGQYSKHYGYSKDILGRSSIYQKSLFEEDSVKTLQFRFHHFVPKRDGVIGYKTDGKSIKFSQRDTIYVTKIYAGSYLKHKNITWTYHCYNPGRYVTCLDVYIPMADLTDVGDIIQTKRENKIQHMRSEFIRQAIYFSGLILGCVVILILGNMIKSAANRKASNQLQALALPAGFKIRKLIIFEYRSKEPGGSSGYSGTISGSHVTLTPTYNSKTIKRPGWYIQGQNLGDKVLKEVAVNFHETYGDQYGEKENYLHRVIHENIRPKEPRNFFYYSHDRALQSIVKLSSIDVFGDHLESRLINIQMNNSSSYFPLSIIALISTIVSALSFDGDNLSSLITCVGALCYLMCALLNLANITPPLLMMAGMLISLFGNAPYTILIGALYLTCLWQRRYSLQDFYCTTTSHELSKEKATVGFNKESDRGYEVR